MELPSTSETPRRIQQKRFNKKQRAASEHSTKRLNQTQSLRSNSTESWRGNRTPCNDSTTSTNLKKSNPTYEEYITRVICPFCLKVQKDSNDMVKHLDTKCRFRIKKEIPFTSFQILPTNDIKCNLCNLLLNSIEAYFRHSESHQKNSEDPTFLFCAPCKMFVLDNYIHLKCHMAHEIHNSRRRSMLEPYYYLNRGIKSIYCLYNENKKFKCLTCPPSCFLLDTPLEIIHHFKTPTHKRYLKQNFITVKIYCCFCDEEISDPEILYHFAMENHLEKANRITEQRSFKLCFYCGFACKLLKGLSDHMRLNCEEIKKIRSILGLNAKPTAATIQEANPKKHEINKNKCILVEDNVDIIELVKALQKFGKIIFVDSYDDHRMVIEFKKEATVETILLLSNFIKVNDEKLRVQFFGEADEGETKEACKQ